MKHYPPCFDLVNIGRICPTLATLQERKQKASPVLTVCLFSVPIPSDFWLCAFTQTPMHIDEGKKPLFWNYPSTREPAVFCLQRGGCVSDSTPQHGVSTLQANGHLGEVASLLELPLSAGTSGLLFGGEGGFVSDWTPQVYPGTPGVGALAALR